jgi:hypothetical protein
MAEPSVKGAMLLLSVLRTRRLRQGAEAWDEKSEQKQLSPTALALVRLGRELPPGLFEKGLSAATLALLDSEIHVARWYPMWQMNELEEFRWEHAVKHDPELARRAGAASFETMRQSGRYRQFEYAEQAGVAASRMELLRLARLISSVLAGFYDFLAVEVRLDRDTDELQIVYGNAAAFCEPLRFVTEGFMTAVSRVRCGVTDWTSERVAPDRIVFTLPHASERR